MRYGRDWRQRLAGGATEMDGYGVDADVVGPGEEWIWAGSRPQNATELPPPLPPPPSRPPSPDAAADAMTNDATTYDATTNDATTYDATTYDAAMAAYQARLAAQGQPQAPGQVQPGGAPGPVPSGVAAQGEPEAATPGPASAADTAGHAARLALGMTVLAAERLGSPTNGAFALGVGLAQQTAIGLRGLADRFAGRPARAAFRTFDRASRRSVLRANEGPLTRRRAEFERMVERARQRGQATVETGRREASTFLQASVNDGMAWAEERAVPQMVDGLVPHLVESVVPQIVDGMVPHLVETVVPQVLEGVMPEIRARVLPVIIDDLTNDPRLRELVLEQSRGAVGEAAAQLRSATATADDRVEQAFRRLVRGESGTRHEPGATGETGSPGAAEQSSREG